MLDVATIMRYNTGVNGSDVRFYAWQQSGNRNSDSPSFQDNKGSPDMSHHNAITNMLKYICWERVGIMEINPEAKENQGFRVYFIRREYILSTFLFFILFSVVFDWRASPVQ